MVLGGVGQAGRAFAAVPRAGRHRSVLQAGALWAGALSLVNVLCLVRSALGWVTATRGQKRERAPATFPRAESRGQTFCCLGGTLWGLGKNQAQAGLGTRKCRGILASGSLGHSF